MGNMILRLPGYDTVLDIPNGYVGCYNLSTSTFMRNPLDILMRNDLFIDEDMSRNIQDCLNHGSVNINSDRNLIFLSNITWDSNTDFSVVSRGSVVFNDSAYITSLGSGSVIIKSGIASLTGDGTVVFKGAAAQIGIQGSGKVEIHYNPTNPSLTL